MTPSDQRSSTGRLLLGGVAVLVLLVALPAVIQGAPLLDDFERCNAGDVGLSSYLRTTFDGTGVVRPIRFPVITLIAMACGEVPFGLLVGLTLLLTLAAALLLVGLLRDLDVPGHWPEIGGALFLLYPLGAESALWPSAMHIPLGLALAVAALRLWSRNNLVAAVLAGFAASLCIEQVIFALPLAAWLVAPQADRRRALIYSLMVAGAVVAAYAAWPGENGRTAVAISERVANLVKEPAWFISFPATSIGLHSMPLAALWAFPLTALALTFGALAGIRVAPKVLDKAPDLHRPSPPLLLGGIALIALVNLPAIMTVPREDSPRVFTPTWLVLAALAAFLGSQTRWHRLRLVGAVGGTLVAAALLSLAFSVSVRVRTADATSEAFEWIGSQIADGDAVAVCDVRRTAVEPAPVGAYAQSDFLFEWAAEPALFYYTGVRAQFLLGGRHWDDRCPPTIDEADLVTTFDELLSIQNEGD